MQNNKNNISNITTIETFLNTEVANFASYNSLRSLASLVDGNKNAQRKVIWGMRNKPSGKDFKVSTLAGEIQIATEYLHGSIEGVMVNMAKNYVGSNNIPLLSREGHFGSRHSNEAAATRYIFTGKEKIFEKMFNPNDEKILHGQEFEGTAIEPRFLVPTLPLILINGSDGIATGFAQKILPRNPEDTKKYINAFIKNPDALDALADCPLEPYFEGFNGVINKGTNPNQYEIDGVFTRDTLTKLTITELPVGYTLKQYTKIMDDLEDSKVIKSYTDLSDSKKDTYKFEVKVDSKFMNQSDDWIIQKLKLRKTITENFTVIDEDNKVKVYNSPEEVIEHYIRIKMEFLQKRKDYLIEKTKQDLLILASKYIFIKGVTDENIIVNKKKKDEIITQIKTFEKIKTVDGTYEYLLRMPIYSLTQEKLQDLLDEIKSKKMDLDNIIQKTIQDTWSEEIEKC